MYVLTCFAPFIIEHQTFETPSKRKLEIVTIASNYHIEVNPSDVGIHDRVVIQELIKNSASSQQIATTNNDKEFKVVVITEVDRLTKDAQHALRRTMEKYMSTCKNTHCYSGLIIITLLNQHTFTRVSHLRLPSTPIF